MPVSISGTNGVTFPDSSLQAAAASPYVLKNRIINGDMRIDQRNAGASITVSSGSTSYPVDRMLCYVETGSSGTFTAQQSTTVPSGFKNSVILTTATVDSSIGAAEGYSFQHRVEGLNVADLGWGAAGAQTVTLSFWVRSSLTGTFAGSITNGSFNRAYVFNYTISAANTWEQKTITIAGDTGGTWLTTNGIGLIVYLSIGAGSNYNQTANTWGSFGYSTSGAVNVIGTAGATFYITGVQLEQNTSATPFERRLYNQELANCQRYYWKTYLQSVVAGTSSNLNGAQIFITNNNSTIQPFNFTFPVCMRASPTCTPYSISGTSGRNSTSGGLATFTDQTASVSYVSESGAYVAGNNGSLNGFYALVHLVASSEL
jgi:hypothetical protein